MSEERNIYLPNYKASERDIHFRLIVIDTVYINFPLFRNSIFGGELHPVSDSTPTEYVKGNLHD